MTKLDDLKSVHRDLTQAVNKVGTIKQFVATSLPENSVDINTKLDAVTDALEAARAAVRTVAGEETMKNGGTQP